MYGFIDFMLKGKSLLESTNLFFPEDYEKNKKIILKYFKYIFEIKRNCVVFCKYIKKIENSKTSYFFEKKLFFVISSKCGSKDENIFKAEE